MNARTRAAGALALLAVAGAVTAGTGANFSAEGSNPDNTFTAGIIKLDASKHDAALLAPSNMKPGAPPETGTLDIANAGTLPARLTLSRDRLESTDDGASNPRPFAEKVQLSVVDCGAFAGSDPPGCGDSGDRSLYGPSGSLAAMSDAIELGTFDAGERHRYRFAAALDPGTGNEYAGDGASARFVWDAVQTP